MKLKAFLVLLMMSALVFSQSASQAPEGPIRVLTSDGLVNFNGVREFEFPPNQVRVVGRKAIIFTKYGLAAGDIPGLDASKITSGIFDPARLPVFVGSGASHAIGAVPDPGTSAGTTRYLREDATWALPPVTSVFGRTGTVVAATNDYTWAQINKTTSSLADITTRSASDLSSGTLLAARMPALTGDVTSSAGSVTTTLANSGVTAGSYTNANITVDAKGRVTSASSGSGAIDNTAAEATLASNYSITVDSTYQDTGLAITLPSAGTYKVDAYVRAFVIGSASGGGIVAKLYNSTDTADVANTETLALYARSVTGLDTNTVLSAIITVAASKTIKLYAQRLSGVTYTFSMIPSDSNGKTKMIYVKLS